MKIIERILDYIKSWLYYPKIEKSLRMIKMTRHQYAKGHYDMVNLSISMPPRSQKAMTKFLAEIRTRK